MMETLLTLVFAAVPVWLAWRDKEMHHARVREELETRIRFRDERLKMIDAELRKARALVAETLGPRDTLGRDRGPSPRRAARLRRPGRH